MSAFNLVQRLVIIFMIWKSHLSDSDSGSNDVEAIDGITSAKSLSSSKRAISAAQVR